MDLTDFHWSDEKLTIRDVVHRKSLPIVVRICQGENDSNTLNCFGLSPGDFLKLDCVQDIEQIIAENISTPTSDIGHMSKNVLIPLRYKRMVTTQHEDAGKKIFHSVNELIKDFPRCVKVIKRVFDKYNKELQARDNIELVRASQSGGLICKRGEQQFIFTMDQKVEFLLLPDSTLYTLEEVMRSFHMPQIVKFIEEDNTPFVITSNRQGAVQNTKQFSKTYKLKGLQTQKLIVGQIVSCLDDQTASKEAREYKTSVIIIPMNSGTGDILVNLPLKYESSDYGTFMATTFPCTKEVSEEFINGNLYVEFDKVKKEGLFLTLPPPTTSKRESPKQSSQTSSSSSSDATGAEALLPTSEDELEHIYSEINDYGEETFTDEQKYSETSGQSETVKTKQKKGVLKLIRKFKPALLSPKTSTSSTMADEKKLKTDSRSPKTSTSSMAEENVKEFVCLDDDELVEGLRKCELFHMATVCNQEALDGEYFENMTDEDVIAHFNLNASQFLKFKEFRQHGLELKK